jgi:hypothetical protein
MVLSFTWIGTFSRLDLEKDDALQRGAEFGFPRKQFGLYFPFSFSYHRCAPIVLCRPAGEVE